MARGDSLSANAAEAKQEALRRAEGDVQRAFDIMAVAYARLYNKSSAGFLYDGGPTVNGWTPGHRPPPDPILTKRGQ